MKYERLPSGVDCDFRRIYKSVIEKYPEDVDIIPEIVDSFCEHDFKDLIFILEWYCTLYYKPDYLPYNKKMIDHLKLKCKLMVDFDPLMCRCAIAAYDRYVQAKSVTNNFSDDINGDEFCTSEAWLVEFAEYEKQIAEIKQECAARIKEINERYNNRKKEVAKKHKITVTNINNAMKMVKMYATTEPENLTTEQKLFLAMYNSPDFCNEYKKSLEIAGKEIVNPEFGLGTEVVTPQQPKTKSQVVKEYMSSDSAEKAEFESKFEQYDNKKSGNDKFYLKYTLKRLAPSLQKRLSFLLHEVLINNKAYMDEKNWKNKLYIIRDEIEDSIASGMNMEQLRQYIIRSFGHDCRDKIDEVLDKLDVIFGEVL